MRAADEVVTEWRPAGCITDPLPNLPSPTLPTTSTIRPLVRFAAALASLLLLGAVFSYLTTTTTSSVPLSTATFPQKPSVQEVDATMSALKHLKIMPSGAHNATVIFLHVSVGSQ